VAVVATESGMADAPMKNWIWYVKVGVADEENQHVAATVRQWNAGDVAPTDEDREQLRIVAMEAERSMLRIVGNRAKQGK
jgi:hypothetical protein